MSGSRRHDALLGLVTDVLDLLVLERTDEGFRRIGRAPDWVSLLGLKDDPQAAPSLPFLDDFLVDAEAFWSEQRDGRVRSGFWSERREDTVLHLTATAARHGTLCLLLVGRDEERFGEYLRVAQLGRDAILSREKLKREIERTETLVHLLVHDLSVPSNAVLGCLSLLEEHDLSDTVRRLVETAHRAALREHRLVQEILESYRSEQEAALRVETDPAKAPDALAVSRAVLELLTPVADASDVRLTVSGPSVAVAAETSRLERVLGNLVENAIRHGPRGTEVRIEVVADTRQVEFAVCDEGDGVPELEVPHLFEKFAQGARAGRVGLGLYFCAMTVRGWGGSIGYSPSLRGGARFWFRLPRALPGD